VDNIQYVILDSVKVFSEDKSFLFELSKAVELINQPSQDENEALNFTNKLVGNINISYFVFSRINVIQVNGLSIRLLNL
jgi:hypothetical protein